MPKVIDETGNRYGRLTVLRRDDSPGKKKMALWICQCDCGTICVKRGCDLRCGGTKSCGCLRRENMKKVAVIGHRRKPYELTGERFGRLTVIRRGGKSSSGFCWICKCDCGNIVEVRGRNLRKGNTRSCGCYRNEIIKSVRTGVRPWI